MRYAVVEILPPATPDSLPIIKWVATDLSRQSAADVIRAWNYQASKKGGWMEIIEDSQDAFEWHQEEVNKYAFLSKRKVANE